MRDHFEGSFHKPTAGEASEEQRRTWEEIEGEP